jgi:dTMP kinase
MAVQRRNPREFYGTPLPGVDTSTLNGKLVVLEGGDGSGRSSQVAFLRDWLEGSGFPTVEVGLKRSGLVGRALTEVMQGNTLNPTTLFLYYATDFADQLENIIIPALRSDFVVLADRYIYTLIARDTVRGADPDWLRDLYSFALVPDAIYYLTVPPAVRAERSLHKNYSLDYWESGMDIRRDSDMYDGFIWYQTEIEKSFNTMAGQFGMIPVDGDRPERVIFDDLKRWMMPLLFDDVPGETLRG